MQAFERLKPGFHGLMAPAGSGKTTRAQEIKDMFGYEVIHVDDFFIGDSLYRKELLRNKQEVSVLDLTDACNQVNWWDWDKLHRAMSFVPTKPVIVEGAILGPTFILNKLDSIYFFTIDPVKRFNNVLYRDGHKRTMNEICARFLVTEYSEGIYYKRLFNARETRTKIISLVKYEPKDTQFYIPLGV